MSPQFTFKFSRIASDREGYYYDNWRVAVPMSVVASTEQEAREKARAASGEPPRGKFWKLHLDRIVEVSGGQG